jgi:TIR domain
MSGAWRFVVLALAACVVAALWPLTPALAAGDALQTRLGAGFIAALACAILAVYTGLRPKYLLALAAASGAAGLLMLWTHFNASAGCLADYDGRPVLIGRVYTTEAAGYLKDNPGLSPSDHLLDAGGDPARLWTSASIRSCRFWVSWGGLLSIPLFALSLAALFARRRYGVSISARRPDTARPSAVAGTPVYDAFLSYRHTEPDKSHATDLLESLESRGLRVAIDVRDFAPNEHFLSEMERCIKESRFVLCIVTSQYLVSDHTSEEAIISKTLDMAERRKRLVPLIFERVELPVWLHGLVGIDFTPAARVEPLDRLLGLLAQDRVAR